MAVEIASFVATIDDGVPFSDRAQIPCAMLEALSSVTPVLQHDGQLKQRCAAVLKVLEDLHCDAETQAACLRFMAWEAGDEDGEPDWPEDLPASELRLLDGLVAARQVWVLHEQRPSARVVEGLRRLLLAIIGDVRVVFILLARQLVALREAADWPEDKRRALARLTADIHAPLANRLGIWQVKWELEDRAFRYLEPATYKRIARLLDERRTEREDFIAECIAKLEDALKDAGIKGDIAGRPKHIYSIWKKMQRKGLEFSDLYDIRALRIMVDDVPTCYAALGVVHGLWPNLPEEFDDYIARPKGNDYKSLHTAVHGPEGKVLEVQIRTHAMHQAAELGVAAHWRYKESGGSGKSENARFDARMAWLRRLLDERREDEGESGLFDELKDDLQEDRVYLLSPDGDVYDLQAGATVLDFAYHVHTEVGHRCKGAKVNGRIVPLTYQPRSGDRIEILTGKEGKPTRGWLAPAAGVLNTSRARGKVRAWFRRNDREANLVTGLAMYERELKRLDAGNIPVEDLLGEFGSQTRDEFLVALALGEISPKQVARVVEKRLNPETEPRPEPPPVSGRAAPQQAPGSLRIAGVGNLLTQLAHCCQPLPGDAVCGFITRGHGITVHRADCNALARLRERDADRVIEVEWGQAPERAYRVDIEVQGYDRKGLQKDVTATISNSNVDIIASSSRMLEASAEVRMNYTLRIADFVQLSGLLSRIDALPNVIDARRLQDH